MVRLPDDLKGPLTMLAVCLVIFLLTGGFNEGSVY